MAETGWPLIPREVLPAPIPAARSAHRRPLPRVAGSPAEAGRQLSIFGAETIEPSPADLAGLLAGPGRLGRMGGTARVSVHVDAAWRVHVLVNELVRRGLVVSWHPIQEQHQTQTPPRDDTAHPVTTSDTDPDWHTATTAVAQAAPVADNHVAGDVIGDRSRAVPDEFDVDDGMPSGGVIGGRGVPDAAGRGGGRGDGGRGMPDAAGPGGGRGDGGRGAPDAAGPGGGRGDGGRGAPDAVGRGGGRGDGAPDAVGRGGGRGEGGPDAVGRGGGRGEPGRGRGVAEGDADHSGIGGPPGGGVAVFEVRTAYSSRLNGLARGWPAAAHQLFLSGPRLRLWVAAAGMPAEGGYALGLNPDEDPAIVDAALVRAGLAGTLSDDGRYYLILGRKRLARLAELVGQRPREAPAAFWPGGVTA